MEYKRNYLRKVICRLDFPVLLGFHQTLPDALKVDFKALLPIFGSKSVRFGDLNIQFDVDVDAPADIANNMQSGIEWSFSSEDRKRRLIVGPNFVALEFDDSYRSFPDFAAILTAAVQALIKQSGDLAVSRLGVRFINEFALDMEGKDATDWTGYISPKLLSMFQVHTPVTELTRVLGIAEMAHGELAVRFQYGMPNPDFPAAIRQRTFVLDYDAFAVSALTLTSVDRLADDANKLIYRLFSDSIDTEMVKLLNGEA